MPFPYYAALSRPDQATYRRSDGVHAIPVAGAGALDDTVAALEEALARDDPSAVAVACAELAGRLARSLGAPAPAVQVLAVRPSAAWGELHGLYTRGEEAPLILVWMRTARHARVVAFRTFLRTLLHELCHHLDFEVLGLARSFHTEGFFKRESSLFHQLVPSAARERGAVPRQAGAREGRPRRVRAEAGRDRARAARGEPGEDRD